MGGKRSGKGEREGGREREREKEEGNEASLGSPVWAKSRGYSAFQYILPDLTPKTNRCASRFATTASALRASAAVRGAKARLFSAAFCSPHWFSVMREYNGWGTGPAMSTPPACHWRTATDQESQPRDTFHGGNFERPRLLFKRRDARRCCSLF